MKCIPSLPPAWIFPLASHFFLRSEVGSHFSWPQLSLSPHPAIHAVPKSRTWILSYKLPLLSGFFFFTCFSGRGEGSCLNFFFFGGKGTQRYLKPTSGYVIRDPAPSWTQGQNGVPYIEKGTVTCKKKKKKSTLLTVCLAQAWFYLGQVRAPPRKYSGCLGTHSGESQQGSGKTWRCNADQVLL